MKRFIFYVISLVALCSCGHRVCTIKGQISDPVDSVKLVDMNGTELDQCVLTDGAFSLKCNINPEIGVSVLRGDNYDPISLIPDSKEITVTMNDGKPFVSGSPLSEELQGLQQWAFSTFMDAMSLIEASDPENAEAISANMHKEIASHCKDIYLQHKDDPIGIQAMTLMMMDIDENEFIELYEQGGKVVKDDARIGGYYEHLKSLHHDEILTLSDNGEVIKESGSFEDFVGAGKYTLVDFWASWCGPCREETPNVIAIFEKYRDKGLVVIGIPVNDKLEATEQALMELGIHYPQVLDPKQELADRFGIQGIPHIIFFGPDGEIVSRGLRGAGIEEAVKAVL